MAGLGQAAGAQSRATPIAYEQPSLSDLGQLSIEELANLPVTSVAKRAEPIGQAPAAAYVITHEDIERSGARSVPEMLRLAPNLQVAQTGASGYIITARGFSGNPAFQAFTNQLLVLIDGRNVYTPIFSGVYWDMQDVLPADVERIEVISGPGATLWGANAVNGVINIITRTAADTQGGRVDLGAGNLETFWSARYGGKIGDAVAWRAYVKTFWAKDTLAAPRQGNNDHWSRPQAGFRVDWTPSPADMLTVQGDAYRGSAALDGSVDQIISGANITSRWNRTMGAWGAVQLQAYYDRTERGAVSTSGRSWLETVDVDFQHSFQLGARNSVVWGAGGRVNRYEIDPGNGLTFDPPHRDLKLGNLFAQDSLSLTKKAQLIVGLKLEDDAYSGVAVLPNLRLSYAFTPDAMIWAAASKAVRSPTPFDRDVVETIGGSVFLKGNNQFDPVELTAFELGVRARPITNLSVSLSAYYNIYDKLRSIEITPKTFTPLYWGNGMQGDTYGLEAWGDYQLTSWWRLSAGLNLMAERLKFKSGASGIVGVTQAGDDPAAEGHLKSSMNLGPRVTLDADLRAVSQLPDPKTPGYAELNARLAWSLTDRLQLALSGMNLLHEHHREFPAPAALIPRSAYLSLSWAF
jgi:iron complex outermembrane receptor protein